MPSVTSSRLWIPATSGRAEFVYAQFMNAPTRTGGARHSCLQILIVGMNSSRSFLRGCRHNEIPRIRVNIWGLNKDALHAAGATVQNSMSQASETVDILDLSHSVGCSRILPSGRHTVRYVEPLDVG